MAVRLAYQKYSANGSLLAPLVILHGVFGSKLNWRSMSKKLVNILERDVFVIDARNHGNSPHSTEMSYQLMCEDVREFMKQQNITNTIVLGHSMGGKTAMTIALTYPHLVEKLIVLDVAPVQVDQLNHMMIYIESMKHLDTQSLTNRQHAHKLLQTSIPDRNIRDFLLTNLIKTANTYQWKFNLKAIENNMKTIKSFPIFNNKTYNGPTLFVGGRKSSYINTEMYPVIKELFPNAIVEMIEGAGHWVHIDRPIELLNCLKNFIKINNET